MNAPKWLRPLMGVAEASIPTGAARREWVIRAARDLIDIPGVAEPIEDAAIGAAIEMVWEAVYGPKAKARRAARREKRAAGK